LGLFGCFPHLAFPSSGGLDPVLLFSLPTDNPLSFLGPQASRPTLDGACFARALDRGTLRLSLQHSWIAGCGSGAEFLDSRGLGA